ncbi:aminomethyltransferase family protein [Bradyrhizobium sp. Leo170]|uniref:aminomethyltransferase family protein n=1 Tax=Bradyrhizobium sp. Leo170 TaxID=1571199 RepID=UPI00102E5971|nr:aminomethyltransferase family protein [Bradyrhizobium sp. Leo170]TAI64741.1 glycine cleavage system protein T [Bradyrhizobium sp. Leo170]
MTFAIIAALRNQTPGYPTGWGGPEYTSWQDEQLSWKTTCYLGDWSFLMDLEVRGPDALKHFREHTVNSYEVFEIGRAKHVVYCNDDGNVIVEGVLMRMAEDVFRVQSGPAVFSDFLLSKGGYNVTSRKLNTFQLQVSGPAALAVCEAAAGEPLTDIKFMRFREIRIAGREVYALRQGMAGEIGFELHGDEADKQAVQDALLAAGAPHGIRRLGRRTAMINHLEAAFPTGLWHYTPDMFSANCDGFFEFTMNRWSDCFTTPPSLRGSFEGASINDYMMSPFDLGWGKSVKFDHDFTGRVALEREVAEGRSKQRVTLEFDSRDVVDIYASLFRGGEPYDFMDIPHPQRWVVWADQVLESGRPVGISSTPGYSLYFRRVLAIAFLNPEAATLGSQVEVVWGTPGTPQRTIRATVHPAPYKKDNRRADLAAEPALVRA